MTVITKTSDIADFEKNEPLAGPKGVILAVDDVAAFEAGFINTGVAIRLARGGFTLFAITGDDAEAAHDALDDLLEAEGFSDVMTTFHDDDTADELAAFLETTAEANHLVQLVVVCASRSEYEADLLKSLGPKGGNRCQ